MAVLYIHSNTKEEMKVNLNVPFKDYKGQPIIEKDGNGEGHEVIMADYIAKELFTLARLDGQPVAADKMLVAYKLSTRILNNPSEVELTSEEMTFVKEVASKTLVVGCYGQLVDILENN